jgi:hypothetical protein
MVPEAPMILGDTEITRKAREFGVDLTLTEQNLNLSPTQRLLKLQQHIAGIKRLREGVRGT